VLEYLIFLPAQALIGCWRFQGVWVVIVGVGEPESFQTSAIRMTGTAPTPDAKNSASPWAEDGLGFTWFSTARVVTRMKHDKRGAAGVERTSTGKWGEKMEISTNQRRAGWHRPAAASAASAASALGTKCHKQTSWWRKFHRWHYCTCI
jgi:hypothetical protein